MKLSPEKKNTDICLFFRGNHITVSSHVYVQLDGNDIKYISCPNVFGLHLDESLSFQNHENRTESKQGYRSFRQIKHVKQIKTRAHFKTNDVVS